MALLLAALWLPMTMHCQLARLDFGGGSAACCDDQTCSGGDCGCHSDVCRLIEGGRFEGQRQPVALPGVSQDWLGHAEQSLVMSSRPRPVERVVPTGGAPPGVGGIWHFVLRAALAPRAPSAVG